jgi:hypothetical protein
MANAEIVHVRILLRGRDRSSRGIRIAARSKAATKPLGTLGEKEMERSTARYRERQRNGSCDFGKINGRRIRDRIETRVMGERGRRQTVKE